MSESESESENDEAILARCLGAWAKEAQLLLGEGVALRAGDVDVVCVHGYGFPELLGGPLYWASMATSTATATRSRQAG